MSAGACPTCRTPYTPGEVVGLGILRARPAAEGGPRVEYRCAGCGRVLTLIPHGEGRYAPPGEAPPEPVPEGERLPPWVRPGRTTAPPVPPVPPAASPPGSEPSGNGAPPPGTNAESAALRSLVEAFQVLGVPVTATRDEVERAFRSRSLACHPDKVAHLDDDFRALAEKKFKRLMEAYQRVDQALPS